DVAGDGDLAAVGRERIAVGESEPARIEAAHAVDTRGDGVGKLAEVVARPAIGEVLRQVDLAASSVLVAIAESRVAGADATPAAPAPGRCVGQRAADLAAGATVPDVVIAFDLAPVGGIPVAILKAHDAVDGAGARHAHRALVHPGRAGL